VFESRGGALAVIGRPPAAKCANRTASNEPSRSVALVATNRLAVTVPAGTLGETMARPRGSRRNLGRNRTLVAVGSGEELRRIDGAPDAAAFDRQPRTNAVSQTGDSAAGLAKAKPP
jgi:hypothetical protein